LSYAQKASVTCTTQQPIVGTFRNIKSDVWQNTKRGRRESLSGFERIVASIPARSAEKPTNDVWISIIGVQKTK
jgi:hypothetical protein